MAAADYKLCDICENKTFYDADLDYPDPIPEKDFEWLPARVGQWKVICEECAKTHEVKIVLQSQQEEIERLRGGIRFMILESNDEQWREDAKELLAQENNNG